MICSNCTRLLRWCSALDKSSAPHRFAPSAPADAYVRKLEELKKVAAGGKVKQLQRDLDDARRAVGDLNRDNRAAKDLRNCFSEYPRHQGEALLFARGCEDRPSRL